MIEMLQTSIAGANLIPTSMLLLITLYWLAVIIGALDINFFHLHVHVHPHVDTHVDTHVETHIHAHVDTHVDAHGHPHSGASHGVLYSIMAFLKATDIPFMIIVSIIVVVFWCLSMFLHLLPIETGGPIHALLLIPVFIVSVISCRFISYPLRGVFKNDDNKSVDELIIGKVCVALYDISDGRLGQAEICNEHKIFKINIKTMDSIELNKGEKALVIKKDSEKDFYLVKKFEGVG